MCVHVVVPALRLGTKQAVPPRGVGAMGHGPSGHSGQDRCYLSAVRGSERKRRRRKRKRFLRKHSNERMCRLSCVFMLVIILPTEESSHQ